MSMVVRNNISALRSYNNMNATHVKAQKSLTRVATGEKLTSAQDDSAAFSISERMRNRIRSLEQAHRNTQNGFSMIRTASEAVDTITETLRSLKEKAINAANDSNTDDDRKTLQKEVDQLIDQIDDTALVTFNGKYLIDNTKNSASTSSKTILLNQSLDKGTALGDKLETLKNRAGDTLGITSNDSYQVSWVINGKTSTASGSADTTLKSLLEAPGTANVAVAAVAANASAGTSKYGLDVYTPDKTEGITLTAANAGSKDQIAGFTVNITDTNGNIRSVANAALNHFSELQRGEIKTGDFSLNFHVGAEANVATKIALTDMRAAALGLRGADNATLSVSTKDNANAAINVIDNAIKKVADQQAALGALVARLDYTGTNLTTTIENDTASESGIRDSDMAKEITNYTRDNLLVQSSQAMLAAANQEPTDALALLQ